MCTLGYKYNKKKVMIFLFTKGASHTKAGIICEACWKDANGNSCFCSVSHPEVCTKHFTICNVIDVHNQSCQYDLRLEMHWINHCKFFRIVTTTLIGMTIDDAWHAYRHHIWTGHAHELISVLKFASILAKDCLANDYSSVRPSDMMLTIGVPPSWTCYISSLADEFATPAKHPRVTPASSSSISSTESSKKSSSFDTESVFQMHMLEQTEKDEPYIKHGKQGTRRSRGQCRSCGMKTSWFCPRCEPWGC